MKTETYLGVNVSALPEPAMLETIKARVQSGEQSTVIAVNPEKFIASQSNETLKRLINHSTFQIPDGIGVILASRLKGGSIRSRITGVDFMQKLLQLANKEGYNVFFYGAKEEVVSKAVKTAEITHPGIRIVGYENGYYDDEDALIKRMNDLKVDMLFVAMGSPKQELWIERNMSRLNVKVFQGVGGSFDVLAGHVKRAPAFYQRLGLEWLYRLLKEPKRWKRQLALPKFLLKIMFNK